MTNIESIKGYDAQKLGEYIIECTNYGCPPGKRDLLIPCGDMKCRSCWWEWLNREVEKVPQD